MHWWIGKRNRQLVKHALHLLSGTANRGKTNKMVSPGGYCVLTGRDGSHNGCIQRPFRPHSCTRIAISNKQRAFRVQALLYRQPGPTLHQAEAAQAPLFLRAGGVEMCYPCRNAQNVAPHFSISHRGGGGGGALYVAPDGHYLVTCFQVI